MGYLVSNIILLCTSEGAPEAYDVYARINNNRIHIRVGYIVVRDNRFKVAAYKPGTTEDTLIIDKWQPADDQFCDDRHREESLEEAKEAIRLYIECL